MMYTVEICKNRRVWQWWRERFYWIVRHDNGNILLTSEMYHNVKDVREVAGKFARINKMEYLDYA